MIEPFDKLGDGCQNFLVWQETCFQACANANPGFCLGIHEIFLILCHRYFQVCIAAPTSQTSVANELLIYCLVGQIEVGIELRVISNPEKVGV